MDHDVIPRSYKNVVWLLNLSREDFGLHQGKKCQSDHGVWGPQKTYFKAYIIHWHCQISFVVEEAKEVLW